MAKRNGKTTKNRCTFDDEFKEQSAQMMLDGHSASSVSDRLGIGNANLLYQWKQEIQAKSGSVARTLDSKVQEFQDELRRVEREREILKKRWSFSAVIRERYLPGGEITGKSRARTEGYL